MKKVLFFILISKFSFGQIPGSDPHWQLLWEDHFNSFDNSRWVKSHYCDHGGETVLMLEQNANVTGGNLIITADNNPTNCPSNPPPPTTWACGSCNVGSHPYTSGWVDNKSTFNVQFGYIEARIKVPYGKGLWPAFWTFLGEGVTNGNEAEVDIFEILGDLYGYDYLDDLPASYVMTTNLHIQYPSDDFSAIIMQTPYTDWHKYAIEWSPSKIIWYIDDYPVRLIANHGVVDPIRIIFSMGIQMDEDKDPISSLSSTTFPQHMYIDYVKVYQLNSDCNDFIHTTNYDFASYNNIEKNYISIGSGGGVNALEVGQDITLRASQYIILDGDFDVPVGASMYADANKYCTVDLGERCTQTFNPCVYDFFMYDNAVKRSIVLGGGGCLLDIEPGTNNILFEATDKILLKPGVTISPIPSKSVNLIIGSCQ